MKFLIPYFAHAVSHSFLCHLHNTDYNDDDGCTVSELNESISPFLSHRSSLLSPNNNCHNFSLLLLPFSSYFPSFVPQEAMWWIINSNVEFFDALLSSCHFSPGFFFSPLFFIEIFHYPWLSPRICGLLNYRHFRK